MSKQLGPFTSLLGILISAYLISIPFIQSCSWNFLFLYFGLIIFFYLLQSQNKISILYLYGFIFQLTNFLILFYFLNVASEFLPYLVLTLFETLLMSLSFLIFGILKKYFPMNNNLKSIFCDALLFALIYTTFEWLRSFWPLSGFGFGRIVFGVSYSSIIFYAKFLPLEFITFLVIFLCFWIAKLLYNYWNIAKSPNYSLIFYLFIFIISTFIGIPESVNTIIENSFNTEQNESNEANQSTKYLKVGVVQGNIETVKFGTEVDFRNVFDNHYRETLKLLEETSESGETPDLIIWPENSIEYDIFHNDKYEYVDKIKALCEKYQVSFLVGSLFYEIDPESNQKVRYNRYVLINSNGISDIYYDKTVPVPFGEYMPLRNYLRQISDLVDLVPIDMKAGERSPILDITLSNFYDDFSEENIELEVKIGVLICFEITQDHLFNEIKNQNPDFIVTPTNNVFFGYSSENFQQLTIARIRAIQANKLLIQDSTVGISALIDENGDIFDKTKLYTSDHFVVSIPITSKMSNSSYENFD